MTYPTSDLWRPCAFACVVLALGVGVSAGCVSSDEDTLRDVLARYERRGEQLNPIWIRYRLKHVESKGWLALNKQKVQGDHRWEELAEYARKGTKRRSSVVREDSRLQPWQREDSIIYTGETLIGRGAEADLFWVSKKDDGRRLAESPFEMAYDTHMLDLLRRWNAKKSETAVSSSTEEGVGGRAVVFDFRHAKSKWRGKYWLWPAKEWAVYRAQTYTDGALNHDTEVSEYGLINGIHYPKRIAYRLKLASGVTGKTVEMEVTSIETDPNKIPDSLFEFRFPKNASIYDEDLKVLVRSKELAQSHLDEVVRRAAGPRFKTWHWVLAACAAAGVVSGSAWYWRSRRKPAADA